MTLVEKCVEGFKNECLVLFRCCLWHDHLLVIAMPARRGNLNIRLVPGCTRSFSFTIMIAIVFLMRLTGRRILVEIPGRIDFPGLYSSPPRSRLIHSLMYGGQRTRWIPAA